MFSTKHYLDYVNPVWTPWTPGPLEYKDLLSVAFQTYLHFLPCPRVRATRSLTDINACLTVLGFSASTEEEALKIYTEHVPGFTLLFHDDMDIAALYAALLLTDFEQARILTTISKDKVLAFLGHETAYACLRAALDKKSDLPRLSDGISYHYWLAHMNVLDKDREDLLETLQQIQTKTRLSWSYLLDRCIVQLGMQLQIGFKENSF